MVDNCGIGFKECANKYFNSLYLFTQDFYVGPDNHIIRHVARSLFSITLFLCYHFRSHYEIHKEYFHTTNKVLRVTKFK